MSDDKVLTFPKVKKGEKCPICAKPTKADYKPFCSKRCADIDLGKWLGEGYRLPSEEVPGYGNDFGDDFEDQ